ncbi:MAG: hypothetical protein PVF51_08495 [Nitrospirota bacterium]|jgi:hypothetical protein
MSEQPLHFELAGPESMPDHGQPADSPQRQRAALQRGLQFVGPDQPGRRAELLIALSRVENELGNAPDAWEAGHFAFEIATGIEDWAKAIEACDALFESGQPEALKALAHGLWLAVTYPIEPTLSVDLLGRLVEEAAHDDIGAVAATTANYVAQMRAPEGEAGEQVREKAARMLNAVAWTHGKVKDERDFEIWYKTNQLDDPGVFLPLLSQALDKMVGGEWWIDRDALRARLPDE